MRQSAVPLQRLRGLPRASTQRTIQRQRPRTDFAGLWETDELARLTAGVRRVAHDGAALAGTLCGDLPPLEQTLVSAQTDDVLEMDELMTFVSEKCFKRWLWTAQCRRTRQIVAFAIGDRSQDTGRVAWQSMPSAYRRCPVYADRWTAYAHFLPPEQHSPCDKGSGRTSHQERWYNTLRQWLGRYTRRSLSFSKEDRYLKLVTYWFILEHNLRMRASLTM